MTRPFIASMSGWPIRERARHAAQEALAVL